MKAPAFAYARPGTTEEACALLSERAGDARILAGGQSLMASLNLRLSAPSLLIDINRIANLRGIERHDDYVRIGALARHVDVAQSELIARQVPLLALALPHVAHPAIRNRGTTCGSLALADPAAEMPACAVALDARIILQRHGAAPRAVAASDFFLGLYETAKQEDEMITEVRFPCRSSSEVFGFDELSRRRGDFALVGVCVRARVESGRLRGLRLVVFGLDDKPVLCHGASDLAEGQTWSTALEEGLAHSAVEALAPEDSPAGAARVRRLQAEAVVRRTLRTTFENKD